MQIYCKQKKIGILQQICTMPKHFPLFTIYLSLFTSLCDATYSEGVMPKWFLNAVEK
jgi:hypothetical protein